MSTKIKMKIKSKNHKKPLKTLLEMGAATSDYSKTVKVKGIANTARAIFSSIADGVLMPYTSQEMKKLGGKTCAQVVYEYYKDQNYKPDTASKQVQGEIITDDKNMMIVYDFLKKKSSANKLGSITMISGAVGVGKTTAAEYAGNLLNEFLDSKAEALGFPILNPYNGRPLKYSSVVINASLWGEDPIARGTVVTQIKRPETTAVPAHKAIPLQKIIPNEIILTLQEDSDIANELQDKEIDVDEHYEKIESLRNNPEEYAKARNQYDVLDPSKIVDREEAVAVLVPLKQFSELFSKNPCIVLLDEINRTKVAQTILNELTGSRKFVDRSANPFSPICMAYNTVRDDPQSDIAVDYEAMGEAASEASEGAPIAGASRDRVQFLRMFPDREEWFNYITQKYPDNEFVEFLKKLFGSDSADINFDYITHGAGQVVSFEDWFKKLKDISNGDREVLNEMYPSALPERVKALSDTVSSPTHLAQLYDKFIVGTYGDVSKPKTEFSEDDLQDVSHNKNTITNPFLMGSLEESIELVPLGLGLSLRTLERIIATIHNKKELYTKSVENPSKNSQLDFEFSFSSYNSEKNLENHKIWKAFLQKGVPQIIMKETRNEHLLYRWSSMFMEFLSKEVSITEWRSRDLENNILEQKISINESLFQNYNYRALGVVPTLQNPVTSTEWIWGDNKVENKIALKNTLAFIKFIFTNGSININESGLTTLQSMLITNVAQSPADIYNSLGLLGEVRALGLKVSENTSTNIPLLQPYTKDENGNIVDNNILGIIFGNEYKTKIISLMKNLNLNENSAIGSYIKAFVQKPVAAAGGAQQNKKANNTAQNQGGHRTSLDDDDITPRQPNLDKNDFDEFLAKTLEEPLDGDRKNLRESKYRIIFKEKRK